LGEGRVEQGEEGNSGEEVEAMSIKGEYVVKIQHTYVCEACSEEEALRKALAALISDASGAVADYLARRDSLRGAIELRFDFEVKKKEVI